MLTGRSAARVSDVHASSTPTDADDLLVMIRDQVEIEKATGGKPFQKDTKGIAPPSRNQAATAYSSKSNSTRWRNIEGDSEGTAGA